MEYKKENSVIFVCGETRFNEDMSMKNILIGHLATNWAVRTHYDENGDDPRSSKETLFRNISSSCVFIFIFSEETTLNAFYLNQLGVAFARGITIVGVREPSYIMPNPLPEHYYSTEIVDPPTADHRNRTRSRNKPTLASILTDAFCNAVVYTTEFKKSCVERLFRKVSDAFSKANRERTKPSNFNDYGRRVTKREPFNHQKIWSSTGGRSLCPKCGTLVKKSGKSGISHKVNSIDNLYKNENSRPSSRQEVRTTPQLVITKSVLQPSVGQENFSKSIFKANSRRPITSVVRKISSARMASGRYTKETALQSRPTSTKSCNGVPSRELQTFSKGSPIKKLEEKQKELVLFQIEDKDQTSSEKEKKQKRNEVLQKTSTGFVKNHRGAFLRKMSSLPCIPTTYLVSEPGSNVPALIKYPLTSNTLTVSDANVPEFTDDEDKETIHISRQPSPAISTCSTNIEE